jgi:hypothetical protein
MRFLKKHRSRIYSVIDSCYCCKIRYRLVISAMPCLLGALPPLHYGPPFSVTSVGLFCVVLALFYGQFIEFCRVTTEQFINSHKNGM